VNEAAKPSPAREGLLVLLRHGESEWNRSNRFTGRADPELSEAGGAEARRAGKALRRHGIRFDAAFSSALRRARDTLALVLDELGQGGLEVHATAALDEQDCGVLTGLDKDEARRRFGKAQVRAWRSLDGAPPGGESLRDAAARVVPCFEQVIRPRVRAGASVLVVAHSNSLRALIPSLERLSGEEVLKRRFATAVPIFYRLGADGSIAKEVPA